MTPLSFFPLSICTITDSKAENPYNTSFVTHETLTLMFLSTSPLQREMRGTVKGFHTGSKVFFMT